MSKPTPEELKTILELHRQWRAGEAGGARANLARADLAGADLADADLARANLARADLAGADLARADLAGAYLAGANLAGADLAGADLAGADLAGAYLADADLADADLADANLARADLAGAYLAGADLADADLADADLADADLADARGLTAAPGQATESTPPASREPYVRGRAPDYTARAARYRERHPEVPVVPALDARMLEAITTGGGQLDMSDWHTCATTHCRAGWATTLAGAAGMELEEKYGPRVAGAMIYRASTGRAPHFFASDERALEDIRRCAAEQTPPAPAPEAPPVASEPGA